MNLIKRLLKQIKIMSIKTNFGNKNYKIYSTDYLYAYKKLINVRFNFQINNFNK
jgi:hypothetical protein